MSISDFTGKRIVVLGAGISGRAAAAVLKRHGATVVLNDNKDRDISAEPWISLQNQGIDLVFGHQDNKILDGAHIVVPSPAISSEIPVMQEAARRGISVWSEVEVACRVTNADIIGITGTNGKTTTTTLVGEIMKETGRQTVVGGNIGLGLSEEAADLPRTAVVVAEPSSFQLEFTSSLKAKAAVILNITPDHLDRHHTMEAYCAAKKRIFLNQEDTDYAVLNFDDPLVRPMGRELTGTVLYISVHEEVPAGAFAKDGNLYIRLHGEELCLCAEKDLHLFGKHNIQNCLAAALLTYAVGAPVETIRKVLKEFRGVEHRLEWVRDVKGVAYYNDSKGTNTDASERALEAFTDGHLILIAGGHDKMTSLDGFMKLVKEKVDTLILLGEAAERFETEARKAGVEDIRRVGFSMEEAVKLAHEIAAPPQTVLLSPACSSYDMYNHFEERGDDFKHIVASL